MRPIHIILFLLPGFLSCKDQGSRAKFVDTAVTKPAEQTALSVAADEGPKKAYYLVTAHLELSSFSVACLSKFMLPSGKLQHDTAYYYTGRYCIAVRDKSAKTSDTIELKSIDQNGCPTCPLDLTDITGESRIRPLFLRVIIAGEDLYTNSFIGYRNGKLEELFRLEDTEESGVSMVRTDSASLRGFIWGIDEIVHTVQHNYPVIVDLNTYAVSHPLPDTQYIGFRTVATENFRAHGVINGQMDSVLFDVKKGDSLTIDTFYRARGKIRLLTDESNRIEIKLETGQKKLWSPGAPG